MPENESQNKSRLQQIRNAGDRVSSTAEQAKGAMAEAARHKWKAPYEAVKLAIQFRKKIEDHDNTPFLILVIAAALTDAFEIIPGIGSLGTFAVQIFIFIVLWGKGAWKIKLVFRILAFLEMIPVIDVLPMATIGVVYVWHHIAKEANEAKEEQGKLSKKLSLARNG